MGLITVQIDEDTAIGMLLDRCEAWGTSKENIDLFEKMYESYVSSGVFSGGEFNVMSIVDNDVVNYTSVIYKGEKDFDKLLEIYHREGTTDVSCEDFEDISPAYIEAVSDDETRILVRF